MNTNKYELLKLTWLVKKAHQESLNQTIEANDLSPTEGLILLFLYKHDLNTAKEIAEYRSISKSLVSKSLQNLLKRDLIHLTVDRDDKRINRIELNDKANPIIKQLNQDEIEFYTSLEDGLDFEDKKHLKKITNTIFENVSKLVEQQTEEEL